MKVYRDKLVVGFQSARIADELDSSKSIKCPHVASDSIIKTDEAKVGRPVSRNK